MVLTYVPIMRNGNVNLEILGTFSAPRIQTTCCVKLSVITASMEYLTTFWTVFPPISWIFCIWKIRLNYWRNEISAYVSFRIVACVQIDLAFAHYLWDHDQIFSTHLYRWMASVAEGKNCDVCIGPDRHFLALVLIIHSFFVELNSQIVVDLLYNYLEKNNNCRYRYRC